MGNGKRLFERITEAEESARYAGAVFGGAMPQDSLQALIDSIGGYLKKLLNTRQGTVPQALDFGTPDLADLAQAFGGTVVADIETSLAESIEKYEPRLQDVRVLYVPDKSRPFSAGFTVSGNIRHGKSVVPLVYETQIAPDGHIEVQGII